MIFSSRSSHEVVVTSSRSVLACGLGLGLAVGRCFHRRRIAPAQKVASVEGITEYRLDNGLRVLLFPDPSRPKVTVNLTVLVGSRHEGYGETGMAHLLEHMVFKGTPDPSRHPRRDEGARRPVQRHDMVDRTNYFETLPASDENLEFAIQLEADRMVNSPIKAEDLATEFSVVRNEFEMGENSPERVLSQRMMAVAYEWHNYGKSTIGNRTDIERVPVDNLRASTRSSTSPTTPCSSSPASSTRRRRWNTSTSTSAPCPARTASCPRPTPKSRPRTASVS